MAVKTLEVTIPERLASRAQELVSEGWFTDINALVAEALRRYLEAHQTELMERFIREDVEWGLYGED